MLLQYVTILAAKAAVDSKPVAVGSPLPTELTDTDNLKLGWLWRRGSPLTIPNREVKPVCADGTAVTGGRVGRCLLLKDLYMIVGVFFFRKITGGRALTMLFEACQDPDQRQKQSFWLRHGYAAAFF